MECEAEVMVKKYWVHLTGEEQGELKGLVSRGTGGGIQVDPRPHSAAYR